MTREGSVEGKQSPEVCKGEEIGKVISPNFPPGVGDENREDAVGGRSRPFCPAALQSLPPHPVQPACRP